jgi:hypothetical protein
MSLTNPHDLRGLPVRIDGLEFTLSHVDASGVAHLVRSEVRSAEARFPTLQCGAAELRLAEAGAYADILQAEALQRVAARTLAPEWATERVRTLVTKYASHDQLFLYLPGRGLGRPNAYQPEA